MGYVMFVCQKIVRTLKTLTKREVIQYGFFAHFNVWTIETIKMLSRDLQQIPPNNNVASGESKI